MPCIYVLTRGFHNRVSTFLAFALDVRTQRKKTKLGDYDKPEDDKDAHRLNDLKSMRVRSAGYEEPVDQKTLSMGTGSTTWQEQDIGYHNRYGAEEDTRGPLEAEEQRNMGYHNRFFKD